MTSTSALVDRAIRLLSERGSASPAELAEHVFGGEAFIPLLHSLHDERLQFDGTSWSLRGHGEDWAVLEILASGPNPRRHRIVEVAAVRDGHRFHALVSNDKGPPKLLRKLGVPAETEDGEWRPLDEVAGELRTFLGGATVCGFSYVPDFLDQLLAPAWPAIELLQLLYRVTYFFGRPDPTRLAKQLGLSAPLNRRPQAMLGFSATLFERLRGNRSLAELREIASPRPAERPRMPEIPSQPGVYVMSAANGDPLYVGKSVNLKRRVGSYLGRPIAESRAMYHLTQLTRRIDVVPVKSELEALLLESRLIADLEPAFNIQREAGDRGRYLRLSTNEAFARLTACAAPKADGATYFGPFSHATAAQRMRTLLSSLLRLRTCTRRLPPPRKPRPACAKAASGRCLAPCIPGPPLEPHSREVELARALLGANAEQFRHVLLRLLRERPPEAMVARRLKPLLRVILSEAKNLPDTGEERACGEDSSSPGGSSE